MDAPSIFAGASIPRTNTLPAAMGARRETTSISSDQILMPLRNRPVNSLAAE
jgi:hypothetical protein